MTSPGSSMCISYNVVAFISVSTGCASLLDDAHLQPAHAAGAQAGWTVSLCFNQQ